MGDASGTVFVDQMAAVEAVQREGFVERVRPVARVPGVGYNTRWNRGGPVNRVGRR